MFSWNVPIASVNSRSTQNIMGVLVKNKDNPQKHSIAQYRREMISYETDLKVVLFHRQQAGKKVPPGCLFVCVV